MVRLLFFLALFPLANSYAMKPPESSTDVSLLCIAEQAIGFVYNETRNKWEPALIDVSDSKYTFRKSDDGSYEFIEFGERLPVATCSKINSYGFGSCSDSLFDLTINVQSLRYQLIYPFGYTAAPSQVDQPGNAPHIEIGECTQL